MYYLLNEKYRLRGWDKLPYAITEPAKGATYFVRQKEMDALRICNGKIDSELPFIDEEIREKISKLEELGIVRKCEAGEALDPRQEYRKYPARYIRAAHWSITGKCNYRCKHCYMSAPDAKLGELSHDTIMDIIRQLAECGIMSVSLTGGEPLVRKDFLEIVDALLENEITISQIYSNGWLVTDELLDELEKRGIHPEFNMSYDGEGWHDWLRGIPGAEKAVKEAFLRCRDRGFPTGAELCLHQNNKHLLRKSILNLAEWGCTHLKTNPVSDVGAWKDGGYREDYSLSLEETYQLYLDYIPKYFEDGMPLALQLGGFFYATPGKPGEYKIPSAKSCKDPSTMCVCGHARQVLYIAADGRALPCMSLSGMDIQKEFPLITEQGLAQCITDSRYMRLIDTRVTEYMEKNPECSACEYAMECIGGCRAAALETTPDNIMAPDKATCGVFKGGWVPKIKAAAEQAMKDFPMPEAEKGSENGKKAN